MGEIIAGGYLLAGICLIGFGLVHVIAWTITIFSVHVLHSPVFVAGDKTRYSGRIRRGIKPGEMNKWPGKHVIRRGWKERIWKTFLLC